MAYGVQLQYFSSLCLLLNIHSNPSPARKGIKRTLPLQLKSAYQAGKFTKALKLLSGAFTALRLVFKHQDQHLKDQKKKMAKNQHESKTSWAIK